VKSGPKLSSRKWERPSIALTDIEKVQLGMTSDEVAGIMGDAIHIGYRTSPALKGAYQEILVENPYYEEILEGGIARYRVVYYFTHIRRADGVITDDELTPLVFEDDRLIGKGRDFLFDLKNRVK